MIDDLRTLDQYRLSNTAAHKIMGECPPRRNGVFEIPYQGRTLRVIAAVGGGWDHISVSLATRMPTWEEMQFIAFLFFKKHEVAVQFHVPPAQHINCHPNVLHWWRKHQLRGEMRLPPREMV